MGRTDSKTAPDSGNRTRKLYRSVSLSGLKGWVLGLRGDCGWGGAAEGGGSGASPAGWGGTG